MADYLEELPLIPLQMVLFPFATLQLHIFEDRYRELIHNCLESNKLFGVVLIRKGEEVEDPNVEPYLVGTIAKITHQEVHPDGKMDIRILGESRFRIRRLNDSKPYLTGFVEPLEEESIQNAERTDALVMRAHETFMQLVEIIFANTDMQVKIMFPQNPAILSFVIANFLPISNIQKQYFLEMTDTSNRLAELIPLIEQKLSESKAPTIYRVHTSQLEGWIYPN